MTDSEAKAILERDLNCLKQNKALPDSIEAMDMAIKALEKQIPKKPYIQQDNRNNDCLECPFCDSFIGYECDCRDEHYQIDYCPNCGQAIDWSDEE